LAATRQLAQAGGHHGPDQQVARNGGRGEVEVRAAEHQKHGSDDRDQRSVSETGTADLLEVSPATIQPLERLSQRHAADFEVPRSSCEAEAAFVSGDAMTTSVSAGKPVTRHFEVRRVPLRQPLEWLDRGWTDLKEIRPDGLAHGALIAILGAVLLMLGSTHLYLTAAAVTSYLLVGPVMTTGLCELARRREAKEPVGFDESLRGLT